MSNAPTRSTIRPANAADAPAICRLIRALAEYERLKDEAVFDEARVAEHLFGERRFAEVLLAEDDAQVVGFALFFHNYSTFVGKPGIFLEDLFVLPDYRGRGHGKALLQAVARLAVERGCGRMEWSALNWNEPAIEFYKSFGAVPMSGWTTFRLTGENLTAAAAVSGSFKSPLRGQSWEQQTGGVYLRDVVETDLADFYEHQRDPVANQIAAFPPRDRDAFLAHWRKILADDKVMKRTIVLGSQIAGNVLSWEEGGKLLVGYWLGARFWGQGIATRALSAFVSSISRRPLNAHVAKTNIASTRVLEKCGFRIAGESRAPAPTGGEAVDEFIYSLPAER